MGVPARLVTLLAFAAAAEVAAANDRFVPASPDFVVANVRQAVPDRELRALITSWRADPAEESASRMLAQGFLDRARTLREPMYIGRAEAVLAAALARPTASAAQRRLYAQTLQYRHEFQAAEALLDAVLQSSPRDAAARLQRASVRLVRGDFAGARGDCAQLVAGGDAEPAVAVACLAESYAGSGQLAQAQALLDTFPLHGDGAAAARGYLLTVRAELRERAGDLPGAIADYSTALVLAPFEDSIRAALADALAARGDVHEAGVLLDIERPSLALLVRRAALVRGVQRSELQARASAWLSLEAARGDAVHNREAAMLALDAGDAARALGAARANFSVQKELPDVRVLARAATAAHDETARQQLQAWLRSSGFRDAVAENILAARPRG